MSRLRELGINGLQLFALSGFALAKPLYDLMGTDPSVLVVVDATGLALVVVALLLLLLPPALLLAVEALVSLLGERALEWAHRVFVGLLVAVFVLQARTAIDLLPDDTRALAMLALLVGAAAAYLFARVTAVRTYLSVLAFAPLLFMGLFLFAGPVSPLVTEAGGVKALDADTAAAPDVVMVVFDELPLASLLDRRGEIDAARFPAFARFARDATWYPNATSVEAYTPWAIPAILDGKRPRPRVYNHSAFHPDSLFTLLGRTHDMNVLEAFTRVCPPSVCRAPRAGPVARGFGAFDGLVYPFWKRIVPGPSGLRLAEGTQWLRARLGARTRSGVSAEHAQLGELLARVDSRDADFERFLGRVRPRERRALHYAHLLYPHTPFDHRREGKYELDEGLTQEDNVWPSAQLADLGRRRHLLQLEYTDQLLGRLLDKLERTGLYDDAAVLLVADHGAYFGERDRRYPSREKLADLAPVPFLLKAPGQTEGRVDETSVSTLDVLPTLAEAIDTKLPWRTDGAPASAPRDTGPTDRLEMTIKGRPGPRAPRASVEGAAAALQRRLAVSGDGRDRRPLFAERGMAALVASRVPRGIGPHPDLRFRFDRGRPRLGVQGDVEGGEGTRLLAISACGRVLSVARTYREKARERFAALFQRPPGPGCAVGVALVEGRRLVATVPPSS